MGEKLIKIFRRDREERPRHPQARKKILSAAIHLLVWTGIAIIYYTVFSFFFDTPIEIGMKRSVRTLETEYDRLATRYDLVESVLDNVSDRDRYLFRSLFDSYPLDTESEDRLQLYDSLLRKTNAELGDEFESKIKSVESKVNILTEKLDSLLKYVGLHVDDMNRIPSIQPVINKELNLIATSTGRRIHPFYRTLVMHNGMDYAVPEETRVFATADGIVTNISAGGRTNTSGISIIIDHENGYTTRFNHLARIFVGPGYRVKRGDIIAASGNTGLSFAPHLHYEIRYKDTIADPVHYFFHELNPYEYDRVKKVASVGMQSLD
ncbi:MAG: M23 family metallopeptidase [Rikenellaceae bacterium]|nr:M23 family metallopeptidase [Rikenellaceae bacterium]